MNIEISKRLLGIEYRVTKDELKSIYRKRAIELHPDVNKRPNAPQEFRDLNTAYHFLIKNLESLRTKPKDKPTCPTIFRTLSRGQREVIAIPKDALKEDDLCIYFMWKGTEYRMVFPKGTATPIDVKVNNVDLILTLVEERWG